MLPKKDLRDSKGRFMKGHVPWCTGKHVWEDREHPKGMLGKKMSEETRKLMRESQKNRSPPSEETRKKISKTLMGHGHSEKTKKKISKTLIGRHCSPETEFKKGEEHFLFNNWSSLLPYDKNWTKKFKRLIRKRDNYVCMLCRSHSEKLNHTLEIHHINYDKKCTIPQNCVSLCKSCHTRTRANRQHWTKFFQSLLLERYGYKYSEEKIILEVKND